MKGRKEIMRAEWENKLEVNKVNKSKKANMERRMRE